MGVSTNEFRPIKPPVPITPGWWWWAAGLLLLTLLAALYVYWNKKRQRARAIPVPAPLPPHVRARLRLEKALSLISDPRLFCIEVSNTARVYLEERFALKAPERTTEEFLIELKETSHLNIDQKALLNQFLERCDLVKFARFEPTETELRELYHVAERLIDETAERLSPIPSPELPAAPAPSSTGP